MAFEFKKLSDVNVIEAVSETTNVLVEENGEIVKISTSNILPKEVVEVGILDYTNIMPGVVQYNNPSPTITEIVESSQKASDKIYEYQRICLMTTGDMVRRVHTKIDQIIRGQERTLTGVRIYFGDDLCPIIFDKESNTVYLDPNWVAPAESIPAPATAEVGQLVAIKAVDKNGKPTEWEAVNMTGGSEGKHCIIRFTAEYQTEDPILCNMDFNGLYTAINENTLDGITVIIKQNYERYYISKCRVWIYEYENGGEYLSIEADAFNASYYVNIYPDKPMDYHSPD
jgi:hypothetical protein